MPSVWQKFKTWVSPVRGDIYAAAPIQKPSKPGRIAGRFDTAPKNPFDDPVFSEKGLTLARTSTASSFDSAYSVDSITSPSDVPTSKPKANIFDIITKYAGSNYVFGTMMLLLVAWAILGVVGGPTDTWQILLQNVSSIQVYITDILLLRQQKNAHEALLTALAEMQSRSQSCDRLLRRIPSFQWMETHKEPTKRIMSPNGKAIEDETEEALLLDMKSSKIAYAWNRTCHVAAVGIGSLYTLIIYWIGIFVWVGIGPLFQFSNTWQLYVNTATAIVLTFTSMFLQNVEQRQEDNLERSLEYATKIDAEIEYHLRELTADGKPNPIFTIPAPGASRTERSITTFGDLMGSGIGVSFSLVFLIVWIAVGPMLMFDDNWVLIIGTFTGLIGFIDGFVLRNLYARGEVTADEQFLALERADMRLLDLLNLPHPVRPAEPAPSLAMRISTSISDFTGRASVSVGSVVLVILLIITASAMLWSETGQLLCNTPTMIIEGFLLLVLIQAHNVTGAARGRAFSGILKRRVVLNWMVNNVEMVSEEELLVPAAENGRNNRSSILPGRLSRMFGGEAGI